MGVFIATVATGHIVGQLHIIIDNIYGIMESTSSYYRALLKKARKKYERKVIQTGLKNDPYEIDAWNDSPDVVPAVKWSDMMVYMMATPSDYTREAIQVNVAFP